jgi:hypothetical protein
VKVSFTGVKETGQVKEGRWCKICRSVHQHQVLVSKLISPSSKDPEINRTSIEKAFLTGSNTSCRGHIRQHYEYYAKCCKEAGIKESEHCVPRAILRARNSTLKALTQTKLDAIATTSESAPKQFSREGTLRAVTKFIACDDQAFEVANKATFRNCLTSMRPQTMKADLPTAYGVKMCLLNEFVDHLNELKATITVSPVQLHGLMIDNSRVVPSTDAPWKSLNNRRLLDR